MWFNIKNIVRGEYLPGIKCSHLISLPKHFKIIILSCFCDCLCILQNFPDFLLVPLEVLLRSKLHEEYCHGSVFYIKLKILKVFEWYGIPRISLKENERFLWMICFQVSFSDLNYCDFSLSCSLRFFIVDHMV